MGAKTFLVHPDDISVTDFREHRMLAMAAGISAALEHSIGRPDEIKGWQEAPSAEAKTSVVQRYLVATHGEPPPSISVKNLENSLLDMVAPAPALDQWLTAALTVGGASSCFQANAVQQLLVGKLAVFWGVSHAGPTIPCPWSRLYFRRNAAAGNILAQFDFEPMLNKRSLEGIFSSPVVVAPNDVFAIQVQGTIIAGVQKVVIWNYLFETSGKTVA